MIGYKKNKFCEVSDITINAGSIGANRGYGAFDFFGVINAKPFYLERHLERFFNTMLLMRIKISITQEQLARIIVEIISRNNEKDFFIKLFAYPIDNYNEVEIKGELYVIPLSIPTDLSYDYEKGVKLITKEYQRFLPEAKSTNYLPLVYWQNEISQANGVDVLYYSDGCIRETSRGNVFVVKNGKVYTPNEKVLRGVSRSVVIDILKQEQISFSTGAISFEDLASFDEVFLSSTTKKILPVTQIDDFQIGTGSVGEISNKVLIAFNKLQKTWG